MVVANLKKEAWCPTYRMTPVVISAAFLREKCAKVYCKPLSCKSRYVALPTRAP